MGNLGWFDWLFKMNLKGGISKRKKDLKKQGVAWGFLSLLLVIPAGLLAVSRDKAEVYRDCREMGCKATKTTLMGYILSTTCLWIYKKCISNIYKQIHKCEIISHTTIGQNSVTSQPSCLQCKQADEEWVSVHRLSAAALYVPCFCADLLMTHCLCPSCGGRGGGWHSGVCCMCQLSPLNFEPSSLSNATKLASLGRGRDRTPDGYFSSWLVSAAQCSRVCDAHQRE